MVHAVKVHPALEKYLREAIGKGASDLFLVPGEPVAMRVKGVIERTGGDVLGADEITAIATDALGRENLNKIGTEVAEIHRSCALEGDLNARISVASAYGQYTIAMQICAPQVASVEQIQLPQPILDAILGQKGLVVFSGLVGSGKSTTAYSVVDYINSKSACHICTVEEPVYVRLTPKRAIVQQREVGLDVPDTISGIRTAMVQDCDVIFVMEAKSLEQLEACVAAAEMGHLVITVFHSAATPQEIVRRIVEAFPEDQRGAMRSALAGVVKVVCTQTLLPGKERGRYAAYSALIPDAEMRRSIAEGKDLLLRKTPMPAGCQTMQQAIRRLEEEGVISEETARKALEEMG